MHPINLTSLADAAFLQRFLRLVAEFVSARSTASHRAGLDDLRTAIVNRLLRMGFSVQVLGDKPVVPVVVAVRHGTPNTKTLGLFAHYDVEEAGDGWTTDPFVATLQDQRLYGRGTGDNLGPLALRILALEELLLSSNDRLPTLVWVIQGEEEVASPWAHALFPTLELPAVDLWLEETGYFEEDRTQRILARRMPSHFDRVLDAVSSLARADTRDVRVLDRYLNKAFGEARCPCLTHLLKDAPYLAIGPNDTRTRIHAPNESLPLDTIGLSRAQFVATLQEVAQCA
ncbi:MAG TPA: M20/M25/M40 family metallo-hydrolase [Polyangium sp.]|nr:M20/M25/M40 family metallo-hydrolase [Polyangium sp.]